MGEILLLLQSPGELRQAPAAAPAVVAELAEKRFAGCAGKVFFQPCRPVEVDQRLVLTDAQWDCPDTFLPKPPVQANRFPVFSPAKVGAQLRTTCCSDMAVLLAPGDSAQAFPDGNDAHRRHSDSHNGTGAGQNRGNFHSSNLPYS